MAALGAGALSGAAQQERHGRKYVPPPETAHIEVTVVKATNGKPVEGAGVVFHPMKGNRDEGNMELKTDADGKVSLDVIPIGSTVRLQVIASGFQTYGEDYTVEGSSKAITVKLNRPAAQYSIYKQNEASVAQPGVDAGQATRPAPTGGVPQTQTPSQPMTQAPTTPTVPPEGAPQTRPAQPAISPQDAPATPGTTPTLHPEGQPVTPTSSQPLTHPQDAPTTQAPGQPATQPQDVPHTRPQDAPQSQPAPNPALPQQQPLPQPSPLPQQQAPPAPSPLPQR